VVRGRRSNRPSLERDDHAEALRELEAWLAETGGARVAAQRERANP